MRQIVTADVGGTHARFALAMINQARVVALEHVLTLRTAEHASLQRAWENFGRHVGAGLPREVAIAFAGPVGGEMLKLTNNPWMIQPDEVGALLDVDRHLIINDFGAVAHAVANLPPCGFRCAKIADDVLPNIRPISLSPSPRCQRSQTSALSAAVNMRRRRVFAIAHLTSHR